MNVLIVEPFEVEVIEWLSKRHSVRYAPELAGDSASLHHAVQHVQALILPPSVRVDAQLLRASPSLRVVGRMSAGGENIDLGACGAANVEVIRSAAATANAEAEFVIGALLAMLRRVPVQSGDGMLVGRELGCATIGLIGMTPASRMLAQLLPAFGTRVLGYDPSLHQNDTVWSRVGIEPLPLRELMEQSDGVCVHLPYFPRYRGVMSERVLEFSKPGQVIVSIAHSAIFDAQALARSMRSGRVAAVWFDSLEPGLQELSRPLHGLSAVQVTPCLASTTRESRTRAAWSVARRIDELLNLSPAPSQSPRVIQSIERLDPLTESRWR